MTLDFSILESKVTPLWDFGWFDLTRFRVEGPLAEFREVAHVLKEFLRHPISQRSFCDSGPWGEEIQLHGPFLHERLSPDWFRPVTPRELFVRIHTAFNDPDFTEPPTPLQRYVPESWADALQARGDSVFALEAPDLPGIRVDWEWIWQVYCEFIAVSPDGRELTVAVIGYD